MSLEEAVAKAICEAFWETCDYRERWETTPEVKREVFRNCARRAIEAGKAHRKTTNQVSA